jgi:hypothetical protein
MMPEFVGKYQMGFLPRLACLLPHFFLSLALSTQDFHDGRRDGDQAGFSVFGREETVPPPLLITALQLLIHQNGICAEINALQISP